jgi:hypothetical protein
MAKFDVEEVEAAFRLYWQTGMIREDWDAWVDLFTEDVLYLERVLGTMRGRETVRSWIVPLMQRYREIYGVYEWHQVDASGRVVFAMQNRRDHPSGEGVLDFPGVTILTYAGDMKWAVEEDYWAEKHAVQQYKAYEEALTTIDPKHREKATRLDWGQGPEWTRGPKSFWDHPRDVPRPDFV